MDIGTLLDVSIRLIVAMILGGFLGIERTIVHKNAGLRTYALVSMGSAMFVAISQVVSLQYDGIVFDPLRMASQVIVGIGFLGAGLIFFQENKLQGLTTAAGLWVAAGIGMACGFGLYLIALVGVLLALLIFRTLWVVEDKIKDISRDDDFRNNCDEVKVVEKNDWQGK